MHESGREHSIDTERGSGGDAARHLGADIVARVDLETIAARLSQLPTAALLAELEAVLVAIDSADPGRRRRRAGVWDRLLGRDLVAQAQPDPVGNRVRLGLSAAQTHASELAARADALDALSVQVQLHIASLSELIARERGAQPASDVAADPIALSTQPHAARLQRLTHLEAIVASWDASVAQIALVRGHAAQLLDRHAQVRDLLVALWRERASAEAASRQFDQDGITRLHGASRHQLTALHAILPPIPAQPSADTDRPSKEPSP